MLITTWNDNQSILSFPFLKNSNYDVLNSFQFHDIWNISPLNYIYETFTLHENTIYLHHVILKKKKYLCYTLMTLLIEFLIMDFFTINHVPLDVVSSLSSSFLPKTLEIKVYYYINLFFNYKILIQFIFGIMFGH